jgi:N-acetylglucosamine-6-phosphate deacetylase
MLALAPDWLFDGARMAQGLTVMVEGERIIGVTAQDVEGAVKLKGTLSPGLIDVQVNGGGGALFNDAPTVDTLRTTAAAHCAFGVTGIMPTLITDDRARMGAALEAVAAAVGAVDGVIGLHLEGPWLSGPRKGVHPEKYLRIFDAEDLRLLTEPRPFPLMVTLAPECISLEHLKALASAGVIVCLGHTAAGVSEVQVALAAGARGFTHLYNAMSQLQGREPGAVGAALLDPNAWTGLILDGIHVHPESARLAFRCKGPERLMLVSDAMATLGAKDSSMNLFGETITVKDGALRTADGVLAGAHLALSDAARNAVAMLGASVEDALRMASLTPAEFLGATDRGRIMPGARADFVLLNAGLDVQSVWVGGRQA